MERIYCGSAMDLDGAIAGARFLAMRHLELSWYFEEDKAANSPSQASKVSRAICQVRMGHVYVGF